MKLRKKVRYIILPVIILSSSLVSMVYYHVYKNQLISSQILTLDAQIEHLLLQAQYNLSYSQSYLQQKIDSKEASRVLQAKEQGNELIARFIRGVDLSLTIKSISCKDA
jgi:hypothetical protein